MDLLDAAVLLESAHAKLRRAYHHLDELRAQIADYLRSDPSHVTVEIDAEARRQLHRIHIKPFPLIDWALLIGDCVHNARSALDHAAWSLAFQFDPAGTPGDRSTAFPICATRKAWMDRGRRATRRLPPRVQALIKWVQPYRSRNPKYHPLAVLHELDNEDKHKVLTITATAAQTTTVRIRVGDTGDRSNTFAIGALVDGGVIAEAEVPAESGDPADVEMSVHPTIYVGFRDIVDPLSHFPMPVIEGLTRSLACVGELLTLLERSYAQSRASARSHTERSRR